MDFLQFIKDYYYLMVLILAIIILIIELILSYRVKPNQNILSFIDKIVPEFIIEAEQKYGASHGNEKLTFCVGLISSALVRVFNIKDISTYDAYIKARIEETLSTPQKKGD